MKSLDKILIVSIILMLLFFISNANSAFIYLFKILITVIVISIIFYEKTFNFKDKLNTYLRIYLNYCHLVLNPIYLTINKVIKPINLGLNISLSTAPFIILTILLIILIIL